MPSRTRNEGPAKPEVLSLSKEHQKKKRKIKPAQTHPTNPTLRKNQLKYAHPMPMIQPNSYT
jgi:hypothetical protein